MKKNYGVKQENTVKRNSKITRSILLLALLLLVEIYLMLNFPRIYILLAVIGIASLFLVYRITSSLLKIQEERESKRQEEFESIFKSEKASYILLRKNFADLAEMVYLLKGSSGFPLEELLSAQKSIAKVTINKNRESSKVVLNSTEELKNYLQEINEKFSEIQSVIKENEDHVSELVKNEVQSKNLDVIIRLNELEKAISSDMEEKLNSITISSQTMMEPQELSQSSVPEERAEEPEMFETKVLEEEPEELEIPEIETLEEEPEELEIPEMEALMEELEEEPEISEIKMPEEEPELEISEMEMPEEELEIPEIEMPEEEPGNSEEFPEIESLEIPEFEDMESPKTEDLELRVEPLMDDVNITDFDELEEKVKELQQMAAEEEPEIASLSVEKPGEDLSSLIEDITPSMEEINHKMTPDEIQQLIDENQEEEFIPEMDFSNISEEIPSMEEIDKMLASIPVPEEIKKPEPASDSTDYSHVMTPDEVAALIGETKEQIIEPQLEPEPEPEPVAAAAPIDDNHVMTPDEIAALLASV